MCDKCDKSLEKYKILYTAYADEIRNLWTRSVFLGAFMTLAWGGYGALQLKILDNTHNISVGYHYASFGICLVIIVLSLLWVAMAKGSKFVQKAHEEHIKSLNYDLLDEIDIETNKLKRLFCDLDYYQARIERQNLLANKLFTSYRYSPSKINIALGWISFIVVIVLLVLHICVWFCCFNKADCPCLAFICPVICLFTIIIAMFFFMKDYLKGGKSNLGGETAKKDS